MAKLDWNKQNRRQVWAYTKTPNRPKYGHEDWRNAKLNRQIRNLEARIQAGKGWLNTIPTTDPRYSKWSCKLAELRLKQDMLRHALIILK